MVLQAPRALRAVLVQKAHEVREESLAPRVQWAHAGSRVNQDKWDHQAHRGLMDCLFLVNQGGLDLRETPVTQVYLDSGARLALQVHSALLDLLEQGVQQEMKARLDQEVHRDQWDHQDHLECQDLQENQESLETLASRDLLA